MYRNTHFVKWQVTGDCGRPARAKRLGVAALAEMCCVSAGTLQMNMYSGASVRVCVCVICGSIVVRSRNVRTLSATSAGYTRLSAALPIIYVCSAHLARAHTHTRKSRGEIIACERGGETVRFYSTFSRDWVVIGNLFGLIVPYASDLNAGR